MLLQRCIGRIRLQGEEHKTYHRKGRTASGRQLLYCGPPYDYPVDRRRLILSLPRLAGLVFGLTYMTSHENARLAGLGYPNISNLIYNRPML